MTVEQWGDVEYERMMENQAKQDAAEAEKALIDPESEEALEAQRQKDLEWDKYCDDVPKGYGNTK